ncbi:FxsA family protein [Bacillus chungangensis]|uniref:UPF0716 protein FxsA n=1 Tax=Bacillus chungangensis TaxID=587633 RepID=A0ABT9WMQ0_9BACI|nr:FxsA family protein [Bacillus chungangensis]MDQ0174536.1 UPF0716 protein FxsA [Bacillus chungangensis]
MRYLFIIFILIPALEIGLFIYAGQTIGLLWTIVFIIFTALLGTYFAKQQGLETIKRLQGKIHHGEYPGDEIFSALCIFIGALLLITPGFLTDACGFLLLLPQTRHLFKPLFRKITNKWVNQKRIIIWK